MGNKITIAKSNHSLTNIPFFKSLSENGTPIKYNKTISEKNKSFYDKLPKELQYLYKGLGNDYEGTCKKFKFMALNEVIQRSENYEHFFDIGLSHMGLGFIWVISYYPLKNKYFLRLDGGSDNYDRICNYEKYQKYNPKLETKDDNNLSPPNANKLLSFEQIQHFIFN